jgi:hypothetical protein
VLISARTQATSWQLTVVALAAKLNVIENAAVVKVVFSRGVLRLVVEGPFDGMLVLVLRALQREATFALLNGEHTSDNR